MADRRDLDLIGYQTAAKERIRWLSLRLAAALARASAGDKPFHDLVEQAWTTLLEKDDRTSPEEYPDMCLLTRDELEFAMAEAFLRGQKALLENGVGEGAAGT
jgi:hypothetical protein